MDIVQWTMSILQIYLPNVYNVHHIEFALNSFVIFEDYASAHFTYRILVWQVLSRSISLIYESK